MLKSLIASFLAFFLVFSSVVANSSETVLFKIRQVVHPLVTPHSKTGISTVVCSAVMLQPERAITANHCTQPDTLAIVIKDKEYPILERIANPDRDLAILIIPNAPCPCATIQAKPIQLDQEVILVGYPQEGGQTLVYGHAQTRITSDREQLITTASGAPGKSGGGLFDRSGYLLGIATQMGWGGHITFIEELTPTTFIRKILP